jgi:hypothetical protein
VKSLMAPLGCIGRVDVDNQESNAMSALWTLTMPVPGMQPVSES